MISAISLLVLACAITINAHGPLRCSEAMIGKVPTSHGVEFHSDIIKPPDTQIIIPHVAECVYGVSGVYAYMCGPDVAPSGYFRDFNTLVVHQSIPHGSGTVAITVYCNV